MSNRMPSAEIRRFLRQEVNWGCPISGCGSPFLTYHHFAPPFRDFTDDTGHDPAGIIALCLSHAGQADGGVFTDDQLRSFKKAPFLKGNGVQGRNDWLRRNTVLTAGSNIFVNISTLLSVNKRKLIWFNRGSDGNLALSMNIEDRDGKPLFIMENNDWMVYGPLRDLEVPPRGRSIFAKSQTKEFWLRMKFYNLKRSEFQHKIQERAIASERHSVAAQNAIFAELRERQPDSTDYFRDIEIGADEERTIRREAWTPIEKVITEWPALEIKFDGYLPGPVGLISNSRAVRVGGATVSGSLFVGPLTVFSFDGSADQ